MIPELISIDAAKIIDDKHGKHKTPEKPQKSIQEDGGGELIPDAGCFI